MKAALPRSCRRAPSGLRYATHRLADGVTFVHLASVETGDGSNPVCQAEVFEVFQKDIARGDDVPPAAQDVTVVESYRLLAD